MDVVKRIKILFPVLVVLFAVACAFTLTLTGAALGGLSASLILYALMLTFIPATIIIFLFLKLYNWFSYIVSILFLLLMMLVTVIYSTPGPSSYLLARGGSLGSWFLAFIPGLKFLLNSNTLMQFVMSVSIILFLVFSIYVFYLFFKPEVRNLYFHKDQTNL